MQVVKDDLLGHPLDLHAGAASAEAFSNCVGRGIPKLPLWAGLLQAEDTVQERPGDLFACSEAVSCFMCFLQESLCLALSRKCKVGLRWWC